MNKIKKIFLPISYDITEKTILILGGGNSAWKKINILKKFTNRFFVIAREVIDDIKSTGVPFVEKEIEESDLDGYHIIYSCTNDRELNKMIVKWGQKRGSLVNIHDDPELCDFVSPAVYKDGNITISVGTNGENALRAIIIRDKLKNILESEKIIE